MSRKRQLFKWAGRGKVLPAEEVDRLKSANVAHGYIPDEMPATKHPVDGKYYTSKAKFREVTKAAGMEEVGTAYDHGFDPEKTRKQESERRINERVIRQLRERFYGWNGNERK